MMEQKGLLDALLEADSLLSKQEAGGDRDIEKKTLKEVFERLFPDNPRLRGQYQRSLLKEPNPRVEGPPRIKISGEARRYKPPPEPPKPAPSNRKRLLDILGRRGEFKAPQLQLEPWQQDFVNGQASMERYIKQMLVKAELERKLKK